jgi:hypothetical protein
MLRKKSSCVLMILQCKFIFCLPVLVGYSSAEMNAQLVSAHLRFSNMITTEQSTYHTKYGVGGGGGLRIKPLPWCYVQGGVAYHKMFSDDTRLDEMQIITWDWQLGFIPYQKIPIHLSIGTLQHRYRFTTNPIEDFGLVFLPGLDMTRHWDGWNIGIAYPIKKWLEVGLSYEKEPFYLFHHPMTADYLKITVGVNSSMLFKRKEKADVENK